LTFLKIKEMQKKWIQLWAQARCCFRALLRMCCLKTKVTFAEMNATILRRMIYRNFNLASGQKLYQHEGSLTSTTTSKTSSRSGIFRKDSSLVGIKAKAPNPRSKARFSPVSIALASTQTKARVSTTRI